MALGMALVCAAIYHPSLALYLLGAAVAGAGILFKGAITTAALATISQVVDPKATTVGSAAVLSIGAAFPAQVTFRKTFCTVVGYRDPVVNR